MVTEPYNAFIKRTVEILIKNREIKYKEKKIITKKEHRLDNCITEGDLVVRSVRAD